jgi:SNF2 family DNA or RNA helicase
LVSIAKTAKTITSTKNLKIKSLLDDAKSERFIIFTRFDEFIDALVQYLKTLGISCMTLDDFYLSSKSEQDATRVILLSANTQASGVDLSFANNVIIIEPFDNYIYGKETEKQLIGRVHRIHQLHTVKVYRLFIRGTIEEKFYKQT